MPTHDVTEYQRRGIMADLLTVAQVRARCKELGWHMHPTRLGSYYAADVWAYPISRTEPVSRQYTVEAFAENASCLTLRRLAAKALLAIVLDQEKRNG